MFPHHKFIFGGDIFTFEELVVCFERAKMDSVNYIHDVPPKTDSFYYDSNMSDREFEDIWDGMIQVLHV